MPAKRSPRESRDALETSASARTYETGAAGCGGAGCAASVRLPVEGRRREASLASQRGAAGAHPMGSGASLPDDDDDDAQQELSVPVPSRRRRRRRGEKSVSLVAEETPRGGFVPIDFGEKLLRIDGGMGKTRVRVVDMQLQHQERQFGDPEKSVSGMIAVSEKLLVVRYQNDSTVECFDIAKGVSVWASRVGDVSRPCEVTSLVLLPSGDVVAGTDVGNVTRLDKNGKLRGAQTKFDGYGGVSCLLVEPDELTVRGVVRGTSVLVGTCTGELAWVGDDGVVKGERQHLDGRIDVLKPVPNKARMVLVGTHAGQIVQVGMDGVQARPVVELDGSVVSVAFAPGGERLLVGTYKGQVAWVDLAQGSVIQSQQLFASIVQLAIAPVISQKARGKGTNASPVRAVCGTDDGKVLWIGASPALSFHRCPHHAVVYIGKQASDLPDQSTLRCRRGWHRAG